MKVFITGSSGLIGSELVSYFDQRAQSVVGIDNNMRADFFGPEGDTTWNLGRLMRAVAISWINRTPDMGVSSFRLARVGMHRNTWRGSGVPPTKVQG